MEPNEVTSSIIAAAIEVHRRIGPGLLESAYQTRLAYELRKRGFAVEEQRPVPAIYDDVKLECGYRADLVVNGLIRSGTESEVGASSGRLCSNAVSSPAVGLAHRSIDQFSRSKAGGWAAQNCQRLLSAAKE